MMFMPYMTEVVCERVPLANYAILTASVFFFLAQMGGGDFATAMVLDGWHPAGLFGYMWLHGGIMHLAGNMLFLWLFGNATCARMGNLLYAGLYLAAGLGGAVLHLLLSGSKAVGASAAINGVVGMYLVFYPGAFVSCWYYVLFVRGGSGTFRVQGFWVILLWLIFDLWGALSGAGGTAYWAHLGGFATGFAAAFALVRSGIVVMADYETSLVELLGWPPPGRRNRRR